MASPTVLPTTFDGGAVMKPIPTGSCKATYDKTRKVTYIQCQDTGIYRLHRRDYGAAYSWYWAARNGKPPAVTEVGTFSLNLGDGNLFLSLQGTTVPVGKVTTASGAQQTTGTWQAHGGTGLYKNSKGSGTYTFSTKRDASTYLVLALALKGTIH